MSLKKIVDTLINEAVFSVTPEEWELPTYGFKKGPEGVKKFQTLNTAQKTAFYAYRNFFNDLTRIHGSDVKHKPDLALPPEKEQLDKLRKEWELIFPEAREVIPDRETQPVPQLSEKIGIRIPNIKKQIGARTSLKRAVGSTFRVPKGLGWLTNPKKALYNRIYNRTTKSINESEDDVMINNIIKSSIEKVGMIPDKDVRDAERILKKYNGDFTLALNALAKKINETENKSISERFVNCIRVIHALKTENTSEKI